jgi:hypothetical protein
LQRKFTVDFIGYGVLEISVVYFYIFTLSVQCLEEFLFDKDYKSLMISFLDPDFLVGLNFIGKGKNFGRKLAILFISHVHSQVSPSENSE